MVIHQVMINGITILAERNEALVYETKVMDEEGHLITTHTTNEEEEARNFFLRITKVLSIKSILPN